MKHKYAEMIKAKADNMELVVLAKSLKWHQVESDNYQFFTQHDDYFLCLPQHEETCLHWLNGGEVQAMHFENQMPGTGVMFDSALVDLDCDVESYPWNMSHIFMQEHEIRIKPRKEKRWIGVKSSGFSTMHFQSKSEVYQYMARRGLRSELYQVLEIEV